MQETEKEERMSEENREREPMNPGDEVPPGTVYSGEDLCPECSGSGKKEGQECANCGGTGKVTEPVGGA